MVNPQLNLSPEKVYQKIKHYCAYQERSHFEVKEKLYSFGLRKNNVEESMAKLIEDDLLNEERFAKTFARGKFSLKKWGRVKIEYELKQKRVSAYNIRKGMDEIDEEKYNETLQKLAVTKWKLLKNEQYINRQAKTMRFLLQKGFESDFAQQAVKKIREEEKK
jgi:regulatory protein